MTYKLLTDILTEIKLSQKCPHCNGELMQLSYLDPMSFDFQTKTKIICTNCHREFLKVAESIEEKNEGIELPNGALLGWICPKCGRALSPYVTECPCSVKWELTCDSNSTAPLKIEDIGNCSSNDLENNIEKGLYTYKNGY